MKTLFVTKEVLLYKNNKLTISALNRQKFIEYFICRMNPFEIWKNKNLHLHFEKKTSFHFMIHKNTS